MKIGIDAMGGDFAPNEIVKGAIIAQKQLSTNESITLFGDKSQILEVIHKENASEADFEIVHCSEVIEMGDNPAKAFTKKTDASISVGFRWLAQGKVDGFASA